jgi:3'-5' exoribonuclease
VAYKYTPVETLQSGTKVEAVFLLHNAQVRPKKDGGTFLTLVLKDATGKITGVMWDNFDAVSSGAIKDNDFVEVSGDVLTYNGQLQFRVARIVKANDAKVDVTRFLPMSPVAPAELDRQFSELVEQITDPDYRALVDGIFGNPDFMNRFRRAPSAVSMHQAYIGGLMEHTLCVVRNALKIADNYPATNRSLLICAGLLHDMGKVLEFSYERKISYTDVGRLVGHITMACGMIELQCAAMPGFPMAKKVLVQHIVLSHHGYYEFGSPKRPKTLEALIMHFADIIDAQISNYMEFVEGAAKTGATWEYSNMFERYMFAGSDRIEGADLLRELAYGSGDPRRIQAAPRPAGYEPGPADDLLAPLDDKNLAR